MPAIEPLDGLLDRLVPLVDADDQQALGELRRRLDGRLLRVLVVGEAKRGKSTLINALLHREVLPSGSTPLTSVPTVLSHAETESLTVHYRSGRVVKREPTELGSLVTENGNAGNRRAIDEVRLGLRSSLLVGCELVDTPGLGSVNDRNDVEAERATAKMDVALVVLSADTPISAAERDLVVALGDQAVMILCVLNKADRVSRDELSDLRAFTRSVLRETGAPIAGMWCVSARTALCWRAHSDIGGQDRLDKFDEFDEFDEFERTLRQRLGAGCGPDLERSVRRSAGRIAARAAETHAAVAAALALSQSDLSNRREALAAHERDLDRKRRQLVAVLHAAAAELQRDTNAEATDTLMRERGPLDAVVSAPFAATGVAVRDADRRARSASEDHITAVTERWREARARELDHAVASLSATVATRLEEQVQAIRKAVSGLLSIDLKHPPPFTATLPETTFLLHLAPEPSNTEPLAAALRRHMPPRLARHLARRAASLQAQGLLERNVGRARADFQHRLEDVERHLRAQLDDGYRQGAGALLNAIEAAAQQRISSHETAAVAQKQAQKRSAAARTLAAQLGDPPGKPRHRRSDVTAAGHG